MNENKINEILKCILRDMQGMRAEPWYYLSAFSASGVRDITIDRCTDIVEGYLQKE